ncbi:MAG: radical SAM protein [Candidatus Hadarchaeales archaeon]
MGRKFSGKFKISNRLDSCLDCGFCTLQIACPGESKCTGCGACVLACPHSSKVLEEREEKRGSVRISVNGESFYVPERVTVLRALELLGFKVSSLPWEEGIFAPCRTGGCWACSVVIDGELKPSCITPVREGMSILTDTSGFKPLRLVSGFQGHPVGGVGTPYWLKSGLRYVEAACFAHGCILRCPSCQNWHLTYSSIESPLTPERAATLMKKTRERFGVNRMAISGGEPTLNRKWLLEYLRDLKEMNQDPEARLHVDTNATVLTRDYIDELVEAGMTDIGVDLKGLELETFCRITGVEERLARELQKTEWSAAEYLIKEYYPEVFVGIGIPYNPSFISLEEVGRMGEKIAKWDPEVQVCALDYRAEFRARGLRKPTYQQMLEVKRVLEEAGLRCVICQTERGHVGP